MLSDFWTAIIILNNEIGGDDGFYDGYILDTEGVELMD